ncbi:Rubredoxin-like superfamily protein [Thalictrum thalictroides]|uniref:Rubredoxin-like superfamily protein n=1 Tax=Thalictrum thalictroides TaxID=46969 RepID=A0A7J6VIP7_THATH|nr:Rubredoxin-like superfamily protein [Thalictrum thalictroides]
MALQVPTRLNTPSSLSLSSNHVGLRRPSNRFAFRSLFFSSSNILLIPPQRHKLSTAPKFSMRFANKQAYICRDCGYIYNDRIPFEKQPDNYFCPVCAAPKRRFRPYEPKVNKNANEADARKARKAQLQKDEAIGKALPIGIAVGVVFLTGLYFYLNISGI